MPTLLIAVILLALGLGLRAKAAAPTTNPADLEQAAIDRLIAVPEPKRILDTVSAPLDADTATYLAACGPALDTLRDAAKLPHADWPVSADDGTVLHSLNGPRQATNLLRLQARMDVQNGRSIDAVDHLLTAMALGRHVGQQKLYIARLVAVGCEASSIDTLARLLPGLPEDVVRGLPARLAALPPETPLAETIDAERDYGRRHVEQMVAPTTTPSEKSAPPLNPLMLNTWDAAGPLYDAAKAASTASPADYAKAVDQAAAKLMANPFASTLASSVRTMRGTSAAVEAKRAMLLTAVAIRLHGPTALAASKDPFGAGPFVSTTTDGGFRLSGTFKVDRGLEPVALQIGE